MCQSLLDSEASSHRCQKHSRNLAKQCHHSGQKLLIGCPKATLSPRYVLLAFVMSLKSLGKLQTWEKW